MSKRKLKKVKELLEKEIKNKRKRGHWSKWEKLLLSLAENPDAFKDGVTHKMLRKAGLSPTIIKHLTDKKGGHLLFERKKRKVAYSWFDWINDKIYMGFQLGEVNPQYAQRCIAHSRQDSRVLKALVLTKATDARRLAEDADLLTAAVKKIIELGVDKEDLRERKYGPLDFQQTPYKYVWSKFGKALLKRYGLI